MTSALLSRSTTKTHLFQEDNLWVQNILKGRLFTILSSVNAYNALDLERIIHTIPLEFMRKSN